MSEQHTMNQLPVHEILYGEATDWVWPLNKVNDWLRKFPSELSIEDFALGYISLKRWLTEHADDEEIRTISLEFAKDFLDKLNKWLASSELTERELTLSFGILMTSIGEFGPYRYETKKEKSVKDNILHPMEALRKMAVDAAKTLFSRPEFSLIEMSIQLEISPLLDAAVEVFGNEHDRFMPFRITQINKVAERLHELSLWIRREEEMSEEGEQLASLLEKLHDLKYPRFGTSGLRGRWLVDFTKDKALRTSQAICKYLADIDMPDFVVPSAHDLSGKWVVVGYDGRRNSPKVAEWLARVALANGFQIQMAARPTPTPAITFHAIEEVGKEHVAGIINCTASHNPPDWQGIKFNPREGYPAPTHLTDIISARTNELQLLDIQVPLSDISEAEEEGSFEYYDPIANYWQWIKGNGGNNPRIALDFDRIKDYFSDKLVIIDEMHGAGRGYMGYILGQLGIPHKIIHAERDIDLGNLDYANPELPYIEPLMETVKETGAVLGLGMDTDADRFGVVDKGGIYYRPNQILAMLSFFLGYERQLEGRIVITQTGLPLINTLAKHFPNIERPQETVIPAYVDHPFYKRRVGEREDMVFENVFVVPVGIKYIVEIPRMDLSYALMEEQELSPNWMRDLLLGGEESSGLTTRGHVPDKDGLWANLLIMDMIAHYGTTLAEIWEKVTSFDGAWKSYGGRVDVDASDRAKENLTNYYLDEYKNVSVGEKTINGHSLLYAGGIRYDIVELFLGDDEGNPRNYLRIRASGTEPINRIYTETKDPELWKELENTILDKLDEFTIVEIKAAYRIERLADILGATALGEDWTHLLDSVKGKLSDEKWSAEELVEALKYKRLYSENRNKHVIDQWIEHLG